MPSGPSVPGTTTVPGGPSAPAAPGIGRATPPASAATPSSGALLATPLLAVATAPAAISVTASLFQNPAEPPLSFTPWQSGSPLNQPVSAHPTMLANSAAIVAAQFPNGQNPDTARVTEAGQYDYAHPIFYATSADPLVTLKCTQYCGAPDNGGVPAAIHIPAKARPAGGTDAHMTVVQGDGTTIDFWGLTGTPGITAGQNTSPPQRAKRDWQTGDVASASAIANCGSFTNGAGILTTGPGATASQFCARGGTTTAAELINGQINHALDLVAQCAVGTQYPTPANAGTDRCTSGLGPPLGGRLWYDVSCATTRASGALQTWEKGVLCALNVYGGYLIDNVIGGPYATGGIFPQVESEEPWYDYQGPGYISPFAPLASQGWNSITVANAIGVSSGTRWMYNNGNPWNPPGVSFVGHMHWLAECSARGSC